MSEIEALENQKEDLKKQVELRDAIIRLSNNSDFRKVINQGFLLEECARSARMAGDPTQAPEHRAVLIEMALSAGHLQRFLSANVQMGNRAYTDIEQIDGHLAELRATPEDNE